MPKSTGLESEQGASKNPADDFKPSAALKESVMFHWDRIKQAKMARNAPLAYYDNQTFLQDYYSNSSAVNSYLKPKKNDDDVRVVGGTTEKRVESVVNELASMNFQPEIRVYDKLDAPVRGLGQAMEDIVQRTNEMERDEDVMHEAIWTMITQRVVFLEEIYDESNLMNNSVKGMCRKRLRSPLEVFVGDLTIPAYRLQEQPYLCIYERMTYPMFLKTYGGFKNAKYVKPGQAISADVYGQDIVFYLGFVAQHEVEVVKYMSSPDNEYQIYANGIPMLDVGTEMPFKYGKYNLAAAIPKRMSSHFFYGRPMTASLKYLQALGDETFRNIIRKFRQAIEPPKAVLADSGVYSRDMFTAGSITYGVNADALKNLVDHQGVTQGEMNVLELVKSMQDEIAARGNTAVGVAAERKETATAVIEQQKNAIKMLGQYVINYSRLVRDITYLRIDNIIEHLTDPIGKEYDDITHEFKEQYQRFTLENQPFENGKTGTKVVQLMGRDLDEEEKAGIYDYEEEQEKSGEPVRIKIVNAKVLKTADLSWYVEVTSKPKETHDLDRLMFTDKFAQAQAIAQGLGRPLNADRVVNEFEQTWKLDDWFQNPEEQGMGGGMEDMMAAMGGQPQGAAPEAGGQSALGSQMQQGMKSQVRREAMPNPSLKTAVGAVDNMRQQ